MGKVNDDWSQEYNKAYYVLTADIQLNDVENYENWKETPPEYQWKPVGNSFKGSFDGDGHVISGMYVRSVKDWFGIGLFRELFTGSVSNVKIEKGYLYINDSNTYAGGVIGNIVGNVKVENCSVDMAVCSEVTNGTDCVGGIVGWCQSGAVITECAFHGDISYRDSRGIFGGICGYASRSTMRTLFCFDAWGQRKQIRELFCTEYFLMQPVSSNRSFTVTHHFIIDEQDAAGVYYLPLLTDISGWASPRKKAGKLKMLSFADGRTLELSEHEAEAAKEMLSYASNRLYAQKITGENWSNKNNMPGTEETWNPLISPATTMYQKLVKIFLGLMVILFMMSYQILK